MAVRRSAPAQALTTPGPSEAEISEILQLGARTPDHGKLFPWRFVVLGPQSRADIAQQLSALAVAQGLPGKARAVLAKLTAAPVTILVVSTAAPGPKPVWEQELSAGAVCMNLLIAAQAMGFGGSWLTNWFSFDRGVLDAFGLSGSERVAGFIHLGPPTTVPAERDRPVLADIVTTYGV